MLWAGRVNAISGLVAVVGAIVAVLGFLMGTGVFGLSSGLLNSGQTLGWIGFAIIILALVGRAIFALADMFSRAILGKPLLYQQRVDTSGGEAARVTE